MFSIYVSPNNILTNISSYRIYTYVVANAGKYMISLIISTSCMFITCNYSFTFNTQL